jgi:hypothetical protein
VAIIHKEDVAKVVIIIHKEDRSKSGDHHPWEDLAKSGYEPNINYKSLIMLLHFGYTHREPSLEISFFPHF